jgi:hypothetical protein
MRLLLILSVLVALIVFVALLVMRRPGREPQPEPIDATREPDLPDPETTRHMADPPPGSQGDREQKGMP